MASNDKGRPLPKFGEWDASNPASGEGFTVIFQKARDDKKTTPNPSPALAPQTMQYNSGGLKPQYDYPDNTKWFCCF